MGGGGGTIVPRGLTTKGDQKIFKLGQKNFFYTKWNRIV